MTLPTFLDELAWRGMLHQHTEGAAAALARGPVTGYCGFDASGPTLHIGHLVPVMALTHLQRTGHRPVALVGGGTGMIGDPSGKSAERNLLSIDEVAANAASIQQQLQRFVDFEGPRGALVRNNADWLMGLSLVTFLRDTGKHFSVNVMLSKDSVKSRLDVGISYTEFSYMLLQAYDFLELNRRDGVTLQLGGSDQWGNITAGTELVRKSVGAEVHGITVPLVTTADGKKFGKTAEGTSVWLDPQRTSPFKFYQYWINADDRDTSTYLRYFTLMPREEIETLDQALRDRPEAREAQTALAFDVTARIHGADVARTVQDVSRIVFDRKADPRELSLNALEVLRHELPFRELTAADGTLAVADALVATGLTPSKKEAHRQLQQGSITVNGRRLASDEQAIDVATEALHERWMLIRKGARDVALVLIAGA